MADLFSRKKKKGGVNTGPASSVFEKVNVNPDDVDMDQIHSVMDSMQGKSEDEMQDELFRVAEEQMAAGAFDPAALDGFIKQASPMLTPEQRSKMSALAGMLKSRAGE